MKYLFFVLVLCSVAGCGIREIAVRGQAERIVASHPNEFTVPADSAGLMRARAIMFFIDRKVDLEIETDSLLQAPISASRSGLALVVRKTAAGDSVRFMVEPVLNFDDLVGYQDAKEKSRILAFYMRTGKDVRQVTEELLSQ